MFRNIYVPPHAILNVHTHNGHCWWSPSLTSFKPGMYIFSAVTIDTYNPQVNTLITLHGVTLWVLVVYMLFMAGFDGMCTTHDICCDQSCMQCWDMFCLVLLFFSWIPNHECVWQANKEKILYCSKLGLLKTSYLF